MEDDYIFNLLKNIESLVFTFSADLTEVVRTLSVDKLKTFYEQLIADLKENVGAYVKFEPMYPNFPDQVKQASQEELYKNAFLHYLSDSIGMIIMPNYEKEVREKLKNHVKLNVIGLGSEGDFNSIFTKLLLSKDLNFTNRQIRFRMVH